MKSAIIIMAMSVLGFTAQAQKANNKNSATIVLVHGAWSDATAWQAVIPALKAQGHEVIAVNLPGHGSDATPFSNITLQSLWMR
jgi:pimeloyl-ACP methyl ester carboxylesterase